MNAQDRSLSDAPSLAMDLMHRVIRGLDSFEPDNTEPRRLLTPPSHVAPPSDERQNRLSEGYTTFRDIKAQALWWTQKFAPEMPAFEATYARLADAPSRHTMVDHLAYLMLGPTHIRIPPPTPDYADSLNALDALAAPVPDLTDPDLPAHQTLHRYDLRQWDLPIQVLGRSLGVYNIFLVPQYAYAGPHGTIAAKPGDTVLDLGGSYGDSAVYFAHAAGPVGQVYTWEFLPTSLAKMDVQFAANPDLAARITRVPHAVWSKTGEALFFEDAGPATKVVPTKTADAMQVDTLSVDDFVAREGMRVDFIKMDIESAELPALQGAVETLRRDRPKLAISAYHRVDDLAILPGFLRDLDLGYRMHLRATTIFGAELVLFAECP